MSEAAIQAEVKLTLGSRPDMRIFRNSCGLAWIGDLPIEVANRYRLRRVVTGLFPGSGDLIGLLKYRIEPSDVGRHVGVFLSCEVKAGSARPRQNQRTWLAAIQKSGGIAIVTNSSESAMTSVLNWRPLVNDLLK